MVYLSSLFSTLEVEEQDGIALGDTKTNEEVAHYLKTAEKEAVVPYIVREVTYPMIEIILDDDSRLDVVRKEALEEILVGEIRDIDAEDILESVSRGGDYEELAVAISYKEKFAVKGKIRREQLSHFYSLLIDMKMKLHISENEIYDKERILALM